MLPHNACDDSTAEWSKCSVTIQTSESLQRLDCDRQKRGNTIDLSAGYVWALTGDVIELVHGVWTQLDEPSVLGESVEEGRCVGQEGGRDVVLFDPPRI